MLNKLAELASWAHVASISVGGTREYPALTLYLDSAHKDSPLPREIAQRFHALGTKEAHWDGSGLDVSFGIKGEGEDGVVYRLNVTGYLPATCRIETVEEFIPAHVGKVHKVVCTGGDDAEA
jgi:hypothetical protein